MGAETEGIDVKGVDVKKPATTTWPALSQRSADTTL